MAQPDRMLRLLQGDVGSGKTVVALLAMARAVEAGGQAALMAPTEILARQHFATIAPLAAAAGLERRRADRPREGPRPRAHPERARRPARSTSSSAPMRCSRNAVHLPRPRLRRRRRAAPLRRPPAARHHRQGRGGRHAGDDGDADPAHAGADRLRRHGRLAARPRSRPAASRSAPSPCRSSGWTNSSAASATPSRTAQKVYWICPLVEESDEIDLTAAEERFAALAADCSAPASASCTAA